MTSTLIAVGDGATPRTAATFAFRTHWECFAVDPVMGLSWVERRENRRADRLTCIRERIEDCAFDADRAIVVAVHSHARLDATLAVVNSSEIAVVAMPCCFPRTLPKPPDLTYRDPAVWTDCEDCDAADAVSFYLGFEIAGLWKWHPNTEAGQ